MSSALESSVVDELTSGGRILVSRLHYLGDVILSLPLVHALKRRFPNSEVDYLTRADGADVLDGEPAIAQVHTLRDGRRTLAMVGALRRRRYAAAIDLYSNPRSALLTWLSGARLRVGSDRRGRRQFYTHPTRVPATVRAATEHHLYYARPFGVDGVPVKPTLALSDAERRRGRARLEEAGIDSGRPVVGVHPGGKWEVKRWPAEYFAELSERVAARRGMQVAVFHGPGEEAFRDTIRSRLGGRAAYMPVLSLRETASAVSALSAMVVNDGGIMHVSVAVGTPTVGIFGSSERDVWFPYEQFGPYRPAVIAIHCRPCHSHVCDHISCLRNLTVDMVEAKLTEVVKEVGE